MLKKIISGGQTGVDQSALDAAIELNFPHGGWCPKGRICETGTIPTRFQLIESSTSEYPERTKLNIQDSDGTLILAPKLPLTPKNGTYMTFELAQELNKPVYLLDLSEKENISDMVEWVVKNRIQVLNVAGPRESNSPGVYARCLKLLSTFLKETLKVTHPNN